MNVLFFLIPKAKIEYIKDTCTLRQAVEQFDECGYTAVPIINDEGIYIGTITNGDILHYLKNNLNLDLIAAERIPISAVAINRVTKVIKIDQSMENLLEVAKNQNFVPVVDDSNHFIGIVTRKAILNYFENKLKELTKPEV